MNYSTVTKFHRMIWDEVDSPSGLEAVKNYYYKIKTNQSKRFFYTHNWARRVENLAKEIKPGTRMLDAATGLGSEAIFAASQGARVVGIDLKEKFIEDARQRQQYYQEKLGVDLDIEFSARGIIDFTHHEQFDIIWCMEAISHIYTTEEFLATAYRLLKPGGKILISDPNAMNPATQIQYIMSSGINRGTVERIDPHTGEKTLEYDENILVPSHLAKLMKQAGFKIEKTSYSLFVPPAFIRSEKSLMRAQKIEHSLNRIPLIRNFGAVYTMIGVK